AGVEGAKGAGGWGTDLAKPDALPLRANASGTREGEAMVLRRATVQLGDGKLDIAGTMQPGPHPVADVTLDSNRAPLAPLAACVPALAGAGVGGAAGAHLTAKGGRSAQPP